MHKILVTGGCGYIGSHTIVDLAENGYEVVSIDNFSNSKPSVIKGIEKTLGKKIENHAIDLCQLAALEDFFKSNPDIDGIIHFAAFKYVNESVEKPLEYYSNNLNSLINLLHCCKKYDIRHFVFSSSCSVYGNAAQLPVDENAPLAKAESPYANTKVVGEQIIQDFCKTHSFKATLLRYFNPVGAHPAGHIGENPEGIPQNVVPRITGTALGKFDAFVVAGSDYNTKDGSCIRDYIHLCDIAHAHTLALRWLFEQTDSKCEIFNLGSGSGTTVLELIEAFEKANRLKLNYSLGPRRPGDVEAIYANNAKAQAQLGWQTRYTLADMMRSAYEWEKKSGQ
jgi:UDP-glucose 4-epimerase